MRRFLLAPFVLLLFSLPFASHKAEAQVGSVGIGAPFRTQRPNARAVLHLETDPANPQGLLLPRLNRSQFVGLTSAENGLIIYDQVDNRFYYWLNNDWVALGNGSGANNQREKWRSGSGAPNNSVGVEGDFYYDAQSGRLYQKDAADGYQNIVSFPVLQAGNGIEITNGTISNTGDTNPNDDIVIGTAAGGDLTGNYPNPTIAPEAVTRTKLADEAVNTNKLAPNSVTPDKIAPSVSPNQQLVTNGGGVVQWVPITSNVPGSGEIAIGNGTGVNNVPMSKDASLAVNGEVTVTGLAGRPLNPAAPLLNQVIIWDGLQWTYDSPDNLVYLDGDVTGFPYDSRVQALQSYHVSDIPPADGQVLTWRGATNQWEPAHVPSFALPSLSNNRMWLGSSSSTAIERAVRDFILNASDEVVVSGLQGWPVSNAAPTTTGQVLTWSGTQWEPQTPASASTDSTTAGNGLTMSGKQVLLGGALGGPTVIDLGPNSLTLANGPSASNALDVQGSIRSGWDVTLENRLGIKAMDASNPVPTFRPYFTAFRTAAQTEGITYTLPATRPATNGQVLTANTTGEMSWQTPVGGVNLWTENAGDISRTTGNVGIGTATPSAKLQVDGSFKSSSVESGSISTDFLFVNGVSGPPGSIARASNLTYPDHFVFYTGSTNRDIIQIPVPTIVNPYAVGDLIMHEGTDWGRLPRGTDGQYLKSTATGIEWAAAPTGTLPVGTAVGQVLEWNGSSWIPATAAVAPIVELETQTYTTEQARHLSIDPVDFVLVNEKASSDVVGVLGDYVRSNSSSGTLAASLHLPDGAVIRSVRFLCYDNDSQNITLRLVRSGAGGGTSLFSTNTSMQNTSVHSVDLSGSLLNVAVDNQTYSYKVVAEMRSNEHRIYGVRVRYTVTKPD